jgi:hypothetical protein
MLTQPPKSSSDSVPRKVTPAASPSSQTVCARYAGCVRRRSSPWRLLRANARKSIGAVPEGPPGVRHWLTDARRYFFANPIRIFEQMKTVNLRDSTMTAKTTTLGRVALGTFPTETERSGPPQPEIVFSRWPLLPSVRLYRNDLGAGGCGGV